MSEVRGSGREEPPHVRGQGRWLRGATPRPRSGRPGEATLHPMPGAVTLRSHPEPEAWGCSWEKPPTPEAGRITRGAVAARAQEGLEELSHIEGQERWR